MTIVITALVDFSLGNNKKFLSAGGMDFFYYCYEVFSHLKDQKFHSWVNFPLHFVSEISQWDEDGWNDDQNNGEFENLISRN